MISFTIPVTIERPIAEVFAYVTDIDRLAEWQPNVISVTNETGGPIAKGTRLREVRRGPMGREVSALVEVSAFEPERRFDLRVLEGPLPIDGAHTFSAEGNSTHIEFTAEGAPSGPLRLLAPLLARVLRRQFEAYYAKLSENLAPAAGSGA